jgi:cytochrome oxidase Cu insertion factor (SCO1/SenC/PrrC family)
VFKSVEPLLAQKSMLVRVLVLFPVLVSVCTAEPTRRSYPLTDTVPRRQQKAGRYPCTSDFGAISTKPALCPTSDMTLKWLADQVTQDNVPPITRAESATRDTASYISSSRIPDVQVYNQDGKQRSFYSDIVKGNTVAINFIFTTCTTVCPQLTATFRRVQQSLSEGALRVQLISVSVDPTIDTPERLHEFATKFKAGPGWTFVTGGKSEIDSLLRVLGAGLGAKESHSSIILIGNDVTGNWTRMSGLSTPAAIVKVIKEVASHKSTNNLSRP